MSIEQVVSIVPGMIVQFDKPYNSPMTVEVEDQPIASGDIVKIGDKFGVRVREILKPSERLIPLDELPKSSNQSAKIDRRK